MSDEFVVADFMDRDFVKLDPDMKLSHAVDILIKQNLIAALVVDDQSQAVGILSEKDCLKELLHQGYNQMPLGTVRDYMHAAPEAVSESMPVSELVQRFVKTRNRRIPVVASGQLVGQITRRDVMRGYHTKLTAKT